MDEKKGYIMGIRKVGLNSNEYNFVSDNSYKKQWGFIFEPDREKIIAAQLTYLDFHDWLHGNIYSTSGGGKLPLVGNIDEGFIVTDILLYGAICESALFDLIQYVYKYDEGRKNIEEVKNCFEHEVPKVHKLSNQKVKFVNNGKETNGSFCFSWKESKLKSNSQINFEDLIHAGKALAVYDAGLEEKLHQLRINRNSVHLSEQITQKYIKKHRYSKRDREVAQKTTEELRIHLHNWYYDNVYIF